MRTITNSTEVAEGVWFVEGPASNWVVLGGPDGCALVDAGYKADAPLVVESLERAGHGLATLRAVFVTHAHTDHIGGIEGLLAARPDVAVLCPPAELAAVRGPEREQITVRKAGWRLLVPRFRRWVRTAVGSGGAERLALPTARAVDPADLAAWHLEAVPAPGHTPGSTAYRIGRTGIVATGDAFVTDHLTYRRPREGAISAVFSQDPRRARSTAAELAAASVLLPGHGPLRRGPRAGDGHGHGHGHGTT